MSDKNESIHLCPVCNCVEMQFVERIKREKFATRLRRFKCPVCDLEEMYVMGGPNDGERQRERLEAVKLEKHTQYGKRHNIFGRETYTEP